ncbi:MAG TPA: carboxymuconolactone decarboxylase family protein [Polyangiaceae bacterium]|nr:carboxymuconolactone decarboxylase family protein [Polyangiaceae bacterium]
MSSTESARFVPHTESTAPPASAELLAGQKKHFGFVASPLSRMAESPRMLASVLRSLAEFEESSLGPAEREVLAFVVGRSSGCEYCMALHTALAARVPEVKPHVPRLRDGARPEDARLGPFFDFVKTVLGTRGAPTDAAWNAFLAAGYTRENALDVVMGIATYTLTTYGNRLVQAPLDAPFEPFRWTPPPG